ncbi:MAG: PD40 domain-containing protein [Caedimonas sp.]|nr:PD40 domain-containing protein [Caedimonas sp.]
MNLQGYYRSPAIHGNNIVFISEDDLWIVKGSGLARRLTTGLGIVTTPVFSPDGAMIAFAGSDEGSLEVYVMPGEGGIARRLTFFGASSLSVIGWTKEGILFSSAAREPFNRVNALWSVSPDGGVPLRFPIGPVNFISYNDKKGSVIQRHGYREYGFWKRYRGGTAGEIWIDTEGEYNYKKLLSLKSDLARPLWIGERIYFASDHEGTGNLYSCDTEGKDLRQHTYHTDYYVRNQSTDGHKIVYHKGGDLYIYDPGTQDDYQVNITYFGSRPQRNRKFVRPDRYLDDYGLHPRGSHLAVATRGKISSLANWEGPVQPLAEAHGVRFRLPRWLHDGTRVVAVTDQSGQDQLEIYDVHSGKSVSISEKLDLGRVEDMLPNPHKDELILLNHRSELVWIDLQSWTYRVIDRNRYGMMHGMAWSPDGEWVAYSSAETRRTLAIKLYEVKTNKSSQVTKPVLKDVSPAFDPDGKYLYFLSYRQFNPAWDSLHFELGFPRGMRPYLITLQKDLTSPFTPKAPELVQEQEEEKEKAKKKKKSNDDKEVKKITIDLDGIENRIQAFPVTDGIYSHIMGIKGKALFINWPLETTAEEDHPEADFRDEAGIAEAFDFETQKVEPWIDRVSEMELSSDAQWLAYRVDQRLRVIKADEKHDDRAETEKPDRKSGWIDLSRIRVMVDPVSEWEQIFKEAWRLQRDHFWRENMSNVDWQDVFQRYFKLIPRLSTRGELSDILWEMQGELGTSHAYVMGGDLRQPPSWSQGLLGAEFIFDPHMHTYRIISFIKGDLWQKSWSSPLLAPGLQLKEGDLIWEINGKALSPEAPPEACLLQQAGLEVRLVVSDPHGKNKRTVVVKPISSHQPGTYRDWVEKNRAYVHEKTEGKAGYIHIPDMGTCGFAEFHRGFLSECDREGLIIDVRFNGGGSVSPLLLEKLSRRRLGYDSTRWFDVIPYPEDSPMGPMVALTNQYAGSDGDMFSYAFKAMKLGPLIGKRTWGGVIGIWPRHSLIDGGMTTQPEFSFWFKDLGWSVENYGIDPDIEVDITPQDYLQGKDPQLDRSIEEVMNIMRDYPILTPDIARKKE